VASFSLARALVAGVIQSRASMRRPNAAMMLRTIASTRALEEGGKYFWT
jgi:hypothetical protein